MRNHLYLYSSNLEKIGELREDKQFEPIPEYDFHEQTLTFRNEYGRIKTNQNYYHILVGGLEQEDCPWCGSPAEIVKLDVVNSLGYTVYCIQCMGCSARGPSLNVSKTSEENTEILQEYVSLLWRRYKHRRPWDDGFLNPYDGVKK